VLIFIVLGKPTSKLLGGNRSGSLLLKGSGHGKTLIEAAYRAAVLDVEVTHDSGRQAFLTAVVFVYIVHEVDRCHSRANDFGLKVVELERVD
jgi:hypothetical protein